MQRHRIIINNLIHFIGSGIYPDRLAEGLALCIGTGYLPLYIIQFYIAGLVVGIADTADLFHPALDRLTTGAAFTQFVVGSIFDFIIIDLGEGGTRQRIEIKTLGISFITYSYGIPTGSIEAQVAQIDRTQGRLQ